MVFIIVNICSWKVKPKLMPFYFRAILCVPERADSSGLIIKIIINIGRISYSNNLPLGQKYGFIL